MEVHPQLTHREGRLQHRYVSPRSAPASVSSVDIPITLFCANRFGQWVLDRRCAALLGPRLQGEPPLKEDGTAMTKMCATLLRLHALLCVARALLCLLFSVHGFCCCLLKKLRCGPGGGAHCHVAVFNPNVLNHAW